MKIRLTILSIAVLALASGYVYAAGDHDHGSHSDSKHEEKMSSKAENVGNKICPVSGEKIGAMGKAYHVEHEGKVYNLCCKMCAKDFKKKPEEYIMKINEELEASNHDDHDGHEEKKGSHKENKDSHDGGNGHSGHDH